ncbi:ribose transport system substrate-binding protein [Paenibacillus taihuensis]|uniref:Ribose transport system substrate-binding protein n=1 Tax=Paenibacillus taihuensis TaxID=1156355 RepID=A0A3D9S696_9BACL|nr:substrate-binding domain-containing protein [Paenibacillus taihuensis]REE88508.1 ribose transport system substrate-binding protein [Paenibacillus taihuensis]
MKKSIFFSIIGVSLAALAVTLYSMFTLYSNDLGMSSNPEPVMTTSKAHIVIISQEQGSYMMNEIQRGARDAAAKHGMAIEFWGVYRSNVEELIKQVDIAIASKVDGIIIEGVDRPDFVQIVNKATYSGIPVVTINSDSPGSLRKSYVGSDHYQEGIMMGRHIALKLNGQGTIGVITNMEASDTDKLRQQGLHEALKSYPGIKLVTASKDNENAPANTQTFDILNHYPDAKAFIGLPTESGRSIIQAGVTRSRTSDYEVFMFDDSPQTMKLIQDRIVESGLSQHYEEMGKMSVDLVQRWLDSDHLPLNNSYFTPISVVDSANEGGGE